MDKALLYFVKKLINSLKSNLLSSVKGWAANCQQSLESQISVEAQSLQNYFSFKPPKCDDIYHNIIVWSADPILRPLKDQ